MTVGEDSTLLQTLRIASLMAQSTVNGPGERTVIWLQGCPFQCPGCFNPDFLPMTGGNDYSTEQLLEYVSSVRDIDGVTFSGGEPLAQAHPLLPLVEALSELGISIVLFTGFTEAELMAVPERRRIVELCDLVVAGPYRRDLPSSDPLRASSNQKLLFISDRYDESTLADVKPSCEFTISEDGTTSVTGFPPK